MALDISKSEIDLLPLNWYANFALPENFSGTRIDQRATGRLTIPAPSAATPSVLIFGRDPILLKTRELILSRHGYKVRTAMQLSEIERSLSESPVRLLILCYSLDEQECARALKLARSSRATQSLILISGSYGIGHSPGEVLNIFEGPAKLLSTVDRLFNPAVTFDSHNS